MQAASKNQKACKAYKNLLKKSKIKWSSWENAPKNEMMFVCKDINGDGVKELLLRWNQASHASGWNRIYTYSSGKIRSIGNRIYYTKFLKYNWNTEKYYQKYQVHSCKFDGSNVKKHTDRFTGDTIKNVTDQYVTYWKDGKVKKYIYIK